MLQKLQKLFDFIAENFWIILWIVIFTNLLLQSSCHVSFTVNGDKVVDIKKN